jgi:Family of unknown function (DUF6502)
MGLNNQNNAFEAEVDQLPLLRAIEVLLEPIARMLVRQGIGGNSAVEIVKRAYVTATINVLKERDQPITDARLKIFTGFAGREVERIRRQLESAAPVEPSRLDQVTRLLTTWHLDTRYSLQFGGTPRELKITGSREEYTFASLAQECAPALNATELLKELVALGAVQLSEDTKRVRPVARAYLPEPLSRAATERLGRMVRNFTETLDCNFQTQEPEKRRVDRHVSADFAISSEAENEFRLVARKEGQALLESLDSWLQQQQPAAENGRRVGVVVFQYAEGAGSDGTALKPEISGRDDTTGISPEVVGPYYMGSVEGTAKKEGSTPTEGRSDGDEGVIDVLNYRGPKK